MEEASAQVQAPLAQSQEQEYALRLSALTHLLLACALLAGYLTYSPAIRAPWFYDDQDYLFRDPRIQQLELFLPWRWSQPPPPLADDPRDDDIRVPGTDQPLIADRYVWRLSFALERALWGERYSAAAAHAANIVIHLACIGALFFALTRLLALYAARWKVWEVPGPYRLLPGLAALFFAVLPWAAEPVCYVSARNGSLGSFCVLVGLGLWASALLAQGTRRVLLICAALCAGLAAYGCKENFISALPGFFLATLPVFWLGTRVRQRLLTGVVALALVGGLVAAGIVLSARASGLWWQVGERGWPYFFEIQNPLLLLTLFDQLPGARLALESNHPQWSGWGSAAALLFNVGLISLVLWRSVRWPALLGLAWFYLHLAPTNSILPRPDLLSMRNVYLPTAGIAVVLAAAVLWLWLRLDRALPDEPRLSWGRFSRGQRVAAALSLVAVLFWGVRTRAWAADFVNPELIWARTVKLSPDHARARLNYAGALLQAGPKRSQEAAQEARAALAAESSSTMAWHNDRHRAKRRAHAHQMLGLISFGMKQMAAAEQEFRQSWAYSPSLVTWVDWAATCIEGELGPQLQAVVACGLDYWPDEWWVRAARGLGAAGESPGRVADLSAAEQVPDEPTSRLELRSLQRRAIYELALAQPEKARQHNWVARLRGLGVTPADLGRLILKLNPAPIPSQGEDGGYH